KHATVHHADLWGLRKTKYDWLGKNNATTTTWTSFAPDKPDFRFVPRDAKYEKEWNKGWGLRDVFPVSNNGLKTDRDELFFDFNKKVLEKRMTTFFTKDLPPDFAETFNIKDSSSYDIETRRRERKWNAKAIRRCLYRPFDFRWLYYDIGLTSRPAEKVMKHLLAGENLVLAALRQSRRGEQTAYLVTDSLVNKDVVSLFDIATVFPLYLYTNGDLPDGDLFEHDNGRRPNLSKEFVADVETQLGLTFVPDGRGNLKKTFGPEDVFHYTYAIFHAPSYRERYVEFLKLDFPHVPLTSDPGLFRRLCERGAELVALHTMKTHGPDLVSFDVPGDNVVEQVVYVPPKAAVAGKKSIVQPDLKGKVPAAPKSLPAGSTGRVFINAKQYFDGIPPAVWEFRIGGYQVCEKWLKDRRGRALEHDDLEHYQHTVSALAETRRLMSAVDSIIADHGGWPLA
ncbi:MAG: DNA methyltransferase, partial [Verrucomicrobia bacterium]|nr:DNA methyltransferase [Verrucomicrobiota bacterium]